MKPTARIFRDYLTALVVVAFACAGYIDDAFGQQPLQWNYGFDAGGNARAKYPGATEVFNFARLDPMTFAALQAADPSPQQGDLATVSDATSCGTSPMSGGGLILCSAVYSATAPGWVSMGAAAPGSAVPATYTYNAVSQFGMACNGVADDMPTLKSGLAALKAANPNLAAGAPTTLVFPIGSICTFKTCGFSNNGAFVGIPNLTLIWTGAVWDASGATCNQWGGYGIHSNAGFLFNSSTAAPGTGNLCITMTTPGQEANFPAGAQAFLAGVDLQGYGYPINDGYQEYLTVASEGSGQVCFTTPKVNTYLSTWPLFSATACSGPCGGPGTIYVLDATWNMNATIIGGLIHTGNHEWQFNAKTLTMTGVSMDDTGAAGCFNPTITQTLNLNNDDFSGCVANSFTVDKDLTTINVNNTILNEPVFSTSTYTVNFTNGSHVLTLMNGGAQNITCNNSTIDALSPSGSYGPEVSFIGNKCHIGGFNGHVTAHAIAINAAYYTIPSAGTFNGGATAPLPTAIVPNLGNYFFAGSFQFEGTPGNSCTGAACGGMLVTGLNGAAGNFNIVTNFPGTTIPNVPASGGNIWLVADPYPNWVCTACDGNPDTVDASQAGAQNAKGWTYSNRIYTCTNGVAAVQAANPGVPVIDINSPPAAQPTLWGTFSSATINVSQADTNHGGTLSWALITVHAQAINNSDGSVNTSISPVINLATTGVRKVTQTTVTGNVTGDTLVAPGNVSFTGQEVPNLSTNISGETAASCPIATVTYQTVR